MFCHQNSAKIVLAYSHALLVYIFANSVSSIFSKKDKSVPDFINLTRHKFL